MAYNQPSNNNNPHNSFSQGPSQPHFTTSYTSHPQGASHTGPSHSRQDLHGQSWETQIHHPYNTNYDIYNANSNTFQQQQQQQQQQHILEHYMTTPLSGLQHTRPVAYHEETQGYFGYSNSTSSVTYPTTPQHPQQLQHFPNTTTTPTTRIPATILHYPPNPPPPSYPSHTPSPIPRISPPTTNTTDTTSIPCPYHCGTVLTGIHAVGNLTRHLKTQACTGSRRVKSEYACTVPGCERVYARLDGLRVHMRRRHAGSLQAGEEEEGEEG